MSEVAADFKGPPTSLTQTARLNTAALDSRRGVVRLHPEAIAALGLREWDAVSLLGSRTTAAVVGIAPPGTPSRNALSFSNLRGPRISGKSSGVIATAGDSLRAIRTAAWRHSAAMRRSSERTPASRV